MPFVSDSVMFSNKAGFGIDRKVATEEHCISREDSDQAKGAKTKAVNFHITYTGYSMKSSNNSHYQNCTIHLQITFLKLSNILYEAPSQITKK